MTDSQSQTEVLSRAAGWLAAPEGETKKSTVALVEALVKEIRILETRLSGYINRPQTGNFAEALREFRLAWQQPISNEAIRPVSGTLVAAADTALLGLQSILAATDRGALYENRALHLAAGEALGLEGYSSED